MAASFPTFERWQAKRVVMKATNTEALRQLSTATITMILMKKGLRNVWVRGSHMLVPDQQRIVGPAFTRWFHPRTRRSGNARIRSSSPRSTRFAIEEIPEASIAVVASSGITDAGIFGDIFFCAADGWPGCCRVDHRWGDARYRRNSQNRPADMVQGESAPRRSPI